MKKVYEVLNKGTKILEDTGVASPRLEATLLLRHLLKWQKHQLLLNMQVELLEQDIKDFFALIDRRSTGYPLQYITEKQEFMGLEFQVTPNVLIPRYDTEMLVESILKLDFPQDSIVADIGTGSGAIAISLAKFRPDWQIYAIDLSGEALNIAKKNCQKHQTQVKFFQGDLLKPLEELRVKPNLIVSNPPYIPSEEIKSLMKEVQFEPELALEGGQDGLEVYKRLIPWAYTLLERNGYLALEIGFSQGQEVAEFSLIQGFKNLEIIKDYQGHDRVIICRK